MTQDIISTLPDDFKFSEEIILIEQGYSNSFDKQSNFDIKFGPNKKCKLSQNNPAINDTSICRNCYYRKFADKISTVRKSKRKEFILHQMEVRDDKHRFLKELNDFFTDNEDYFDEIDVSLVFDLKEYINDILNSGNNGSSTHGINLSSMKMNEHEEINQSDVNQDLDIFLSHSSTDKEVAKKLIDLLIVALRIDPDQIRCTSVEGYKLKGGVNTDETLKKEIHNAKVFIGLISRTSLKSHYVLFELGARWGLDQPLIPAVTADSVFDIIEKPLNNLNLLNLSIIEDVFQMVEEVSKILNIEMASPAKLQRHVMDLSNTIQNLEDLHKEAFIDGEVDDKAKLHKLTIKILNEIAEDKDGTLLISNTFDGYDLVANNKSFNDNRNPRERARLEASLSQLLEFGLISDRSTSGTVFGITQDGYDFIERSK